MQELINVLKAYMPEIEERLVTGGNKENLDNIERLAGKLPSDFKGIYKNYDGEKNEPYTGMILGFSLMDTNNILDTMTSFIENDFSDVISLTPNKVSDEKMFDRKMVPFAWDGSRGYICLDMSPDKDGKKGQVVALDYDYDECLWLADSLKEFYGFIKLMLEQGKCYVKKEDSLHFEFETGHFFNVYKDIMEELTSGDEEDAMIDLPEIYWRKEFKADKVSVKELKKTKRLFISKGEMTISLAPVAYMDSLKELIIHNCTITEFESISGAIELKKMILVNCDFEYEKLAELAKLSKFNELTLRKMPIADISCLLNCKGLKQLRLLDMNDLDVTKLWDFSKLQELELDKMKITSFDFLKGYKGLKKLEINNIQVENLDFLENLKKLTSFKLEERAKNEDGLKYIKDMKNLKEFDYPVGDMELIRGCEKLETVGICASQFKNVEAFKDSNIHTVMMYEGTSARELVGIIESIKEYVHLTSYGWKGDFDDEDEYEDVL